MSLRTTSVAACLSLLAACAGEPETTVDEALSPSVAGGRGVDSDVTATADEPTPGSAAAGHHQTIGPDDDLAAALTALGPGDTLFLRPGTYLAHHAFTVTPGTAAAQVQITAADRAHPPLIQGSWYLRRANYWHLSFLRFQGTIAGDHAAGIDGKPTLWIFGGHGWTVRHCEIFGAHETEALGNVAINDDPDAAPSPDQFPNDFALEFNCIHGAGPGQPDRISQFHNIYLGAHGPGPALIDRNVFFDAPAGEHVKIGGGDLSSPDTIANVSVVYNTMYNSRVAGILSGGPDVHGELLAGNLIGRVTRADGPAPAIYLTRIDRPDAVLAVHNYGFDLGPQVVDIFDSTGSYNPGDPNRGDNRVVGNPRFDNTTCTGFHPADAQAGRFGRYHTASY